MSLPVMLFAAGFGTRMGDLTTNCPKPLLQVNGTTLLDHALSFARETNPPRIVANAHYLGHQIAAHLDGTDVQISVEAPDILDTGGGLRAALPMLGADTVVTLNTDAIWAGPNPLSLLHAAWEPDRMDALLVCIDPNRTFGHPGAGDFVRNADGRGKREPGLIYGGAQIIKTNGLAQIDASAFSLNLLWDRMLADNSLYLLPYPGKWCDVGTPAGLDLARALDAGDV